MAQKKNNKNHSKKEPTVLTQNQDSVQNKNKKMIEKAAEELPQNTVSALKTIWVPRKRKENQIRNAVKRCEAALNELMEQADFFKAEEQKILVPVVTDAEIFIEYFFKLKLVGWYSFYSRNDVSFEFPDAGADLDWKIPDSELVRKHIDILKKQGEYHCLPAMAVEMVRLLVLLAAPRTVDNIFFSRIIQYTIIIIMATVSWQIFTYNFFRSSLHWYMLWNRDFLSA